MTGPGLPSVGGRKSSPVGRSGTQDVMVSGARSRMERFFANAVTLPSSRKLFCAQAAVRSAEAAQARLMVKQIREIPGTRFAPLRFRKFELRVRCYRLNRQIGRAH